MCGIVVIHDGTCSTDGSDEGGNDTGPRMLARLRHRGPDSIDFRRVGRSWLGHTRLSIVDVAGGDQPISGPSGSRWVVCNGEIYNHEELRDSLPGPFVTDSDSEVALHAVEAWGPGAIGRLRGMYAFAIADEDGGLVAARDALGVKPLYWARDDGRSLFASELGSFDPSWRRHVEEFPPGHYWTPNEGLVRFAEHTGFDIAYASREQARTAIRDTLVQSVRARMMADVPIGVFLSGGLDSSLVAAIMARHGADTGQRIRSFAAGVAGSSDLRAARRVADHLDLEHHERIYDADEVLDVLPTVVRSMEAYEPSLVRSAVPNYLLAELAAEHVKVVLTGEGADEIFAGYDYLRDYDDADELRAELVRSVEGLHNLNLQRCDRVTMAHGLEARVPFLDRDVIAVGDRIPIGWKLPGEAGEEKRILREAFDGWLPDDILWRCKEQFGDGSGTATVTAELAAELVPEPDWASAGIPGLPLPRSREELAYQRIFAEHLDGVRADRLLGRFATA
ncbi:MAG TPA: asparagine synthase-related protein [Nocardioidaceae bacterium]|nr:asparagine synthase-related protein [Nocardioidaceae bacterium]